MKINKEKCIACGNCLPCCPMEAISMNDNEAMIDRDKCVECGVCFRFDECPKSAFEREELKWPRVLRQVFSDPIVEHKGTGVYGRGTEEVKTNDVTNRFQAGEVGFGIEMGRPGVATTFSDVETVLVALVESRIPISFCKENPVTELMKEDNSGRLKKEVLDEKALSAIIEFKSEIQYLDEILDVLKEAEGKIETVFSFTLVSKIDSSGKEPKIPTLDVLNRKNITFYNNTKVNVGLAESSN